MNEELDQESYKELEKQVMELGEIKQGRELGAIIKEISDKEHEIKDVKSNIADFENEIKSYTKEFENKNNLLFASKILIFVSESSKTCITCNSNLRSPLSRELFHKTYRGLYEIKNSDTTYRSLKV